MNFIMRMPAPSLINGHCYDASNKELQLFMPGIGSSSLAKVVRHEIEGLESQAPSIIEFRETGNSGTILIKGNDLMSMAKTAARIMMQSVKFEVDHKPARIDYASQDELQNVMSTLESHAKTQSDIIGINRVASVCRKIGTFTR